MFHIQFFHSFLISRSRSAGKKRLICWVGQYWVFIIFHYNLWSTWDRPREEWSAFTPVRPITRNLMYVLSVDNKKQKTKQGQYHVFHLRPHQSLSPFHCYFHANCSHSSFPTQHIAGIGFCSFDFYLPMIKVNKAMRDVIIFFQFNNVGFGKQTQDTCTR